jgi:hypothetical protein
MKMTRTVMSLTAVVAFAALVAFGIVGHPQPVQASVACLDGLQCYVVIPGDTDGTPADAFGSQPDCPATGIATGIGCENRYEDALNIEHYLYLPPLLTDTGKLLVFLGGGNGSARGPQNIYPVAATQGYRVIGLTYPAAQANSCHDLSCYGNAYREVVTGENSPDPGGNKTTVGEHPQDSIVNRLVRVLEWADTHYQNDGWGRYLTTAGTVDWTRVHLAGHSNGSSHSSFMGTLAQFGGVGRIGLFAGPNDGHGGTTEADWNPATYIQETEVPTSARYFGLVHERNHAPNAPDPPIYQIYKNWQTFGMEGPHHPERFFFDPSPGETQDFDGAHMLVSTDAETSDVEAHNSVIEGVYCTEEGPDPENPDKDKCLTHGTTLIGYEPAWRCVLGTGARDIGQEPVANAGPGQTLECQGSGGADVTLDGSRSRDADCDVLSYEWTGPFGQAAGQRPSVFLPLGVNAVQLVASDPWEPSAPVYSSITVADTTPPSLQVTLTRTVLWPPNHKLVRIDAAVNVTDSCGGTPPQVVLTSIISSEPDNGTGDGDTAGDIQDALIGTLDRSFLLRAERAGGNQDGRIYTVTYTATDASGNQRQASATVRVPH